ncbi:hypothetical protein AB0F81_28050 [Actinoplanes sp. NPDC024001]|uniref:hypothetical protein n=1 Tax=Actinoplanes sp. NPDC024001 TaxID=3154598 RepID=UPI0033CB52FB
MSSLWVSFAGDSDRAVVRESARRFLDGWLTPGLVEETLTVIGELVTDVLRHAGSGELVLSRRDSTVLVEVLDRFSAGDGRPPVVPAHACGWGAHPAGAGQVVWVEMPLAEPGRQQGDGVGVGSGG